MWRATLKSLLAKKVRLSLTALAVVLGVGFMAGTYVLTDTMNKAFDEVFSTATMNTDVVVRSVSSFEPSPPPSATTSRSVRTSRSSSSVPRGRSRSSVSAWAS